MWGRSWATVLLAVVLGGCASPAPQAVDVGPDLGPDASADSGQEPGCLLRSAQPVRLGGLFTAYEAAEGREQLELVAAEVNAACAATGIAGPDAPLEVFFRDSESAAFASEMVRELADDEQVAAIVGASRTYDSAVAGADEAVRLGLPHGIASSPRDDLTGCTPAELLDPAVYKRPSPGLMPAGCWDNQGLVFRVAPTATGKGRTLDQVVAETWPEATRAAVVYRVRATVPPMADAFVQAFVARTGEWVPPHARAVDDYSCGTVDGQYSCSDLRTTIKSLVASDPQVIVIMLYLERLRRFLEDYAALKSEWTAAEGRPPGYDGINFVVDGTDIPKGGWDKTNPKVSAVVRQVMAERVVVAQPSWDPASEGFVRWEQLAGVGVAYHQRYVYDAAMLLVLSITAADSLEPDAIKAQYREVANPGPGKTEVFPGQYRQARELLLAGEKIHYTGASGPVDIGPSGNVTSTTYELWRLRPDGNAETIRYFQSIE